MLDSLKKIIDEISRNEMKNEKISTFHVYYPNNMYSVDNVEAFGG